MTIEGVKSRTNLAQIPQLYSFIRRTSSKDPFIEGIERQAVNLTRSNVRRKKGLIRSDIEEYDHFENFGKPPNVSELNKIKR